LTHLQCNNDGASCLAHLFSPCVRCLARGVHQQSSNRVCCDVDDCNDLNDLKDLDDFSDVCDVLHDDGQTDVGLKRIECMNIDVDLEHCQIPYRRERCCMDCADPDDGVTKECCKNKGARESPELPDEDFCQEHCFDIVECREETCTVQCEAGGEATDKVVRAVKKSHKACAAKESSEV